MPPSQPHVADKQGGGGGGADATRRPEAAADVIEEGGFVQGNDVIEKKACFGIPLSKGLKYGEGPRRPVTGRLFLFLFSPCLCRGRLGLPSPGKGVLYSVGVCVILSYTLG